MEKIITVKQEPVDEHYVPTTCTLATTTTTGNPPIIVTSRTTTGNAPIVVTSTTTASNAPILVTPSQATTTPITIPVTKPENQPRQSCAVLGKNQAQTTAATPNRPAQVVSTIGHSSPPMFVLSGSPVKLTQIRGPLKNAAGTTQIPMGKNIQQMSNVTFVQVQPINPGKQGSPIKPGMSLMQKVIPISMAMTKSQAPTTGQMTMATTSVGVTVRAIAPKMNIAPAPSGSQTIQLAPRPSLAQGTAPQGQQRLLIPASSTNLQFPHGVISGGVVYLPQQALQSGFPIAVPLPANTFTPNNQQGDISVNGSTSPEGSPTNNRPRKPCNCTKSQCLKLYCDCFAQGEFCSNCNCINCSNNITHERERSKAIKACLERNPHAFHPKIGKGKVGESERRHNKGCHCKRSGCLKNYCECYEAKILCTSLCKCTGCKNFEESPERKTLMHLADAAEVRVNQQNAAKTKLESQIEDLPTRPPTMTSSGERLPFSFVTEDVAQATCQCVIARAAEAEKMGLSPAMAEKLILEEFGRSLLQIIHTASRTKAEQ